MILLHDPNVRDSIRARVEALSPDATRRWGKMSAGQMLWHCNQVLRTSLGENPGVEPRPPFPIPVLKFILFRMPWPHSAPTAPEYVADGPRVFEAERAQCLGLIDRFTTRKLADDGWPPAVFGQLSSREWSCLQARHLDFH